MDIAKVFSGRRETQSKDVVHGTFNDSLQACVNNEVERQMQSKQVNKTTTMCRYNYYKG